MSSKSFWAFWLCSQFCHRILKAEKYLFPATYVKMVTGWRKEKGIRFGSLPFTIEGKNLTWPQLGFHMRTSTWGRDVHVLWSWSKAGALLLAQNRSERLQTVKHTLLALGETTGPGWNGMMRGRKPGPCSEAEQSWETVKLCRIPCGCCWVSRKHSWCYRYSGCTYLMQKYLFSESILSVCLCQSAGSYLLYSWFKLKLLRTMGQPPPIPLLNFHARAHFPWLHYCLNIRMLHKSLVGKTEYAEAESDLCPPTRAIKCSSTCSVNNEH